MGRLYRSLMVIPLSPSSLPPRFTAWPFFHGLSHPNSYFGVVCPSRREVQHSAARKIIILLLKRYSLSNTPLGFIYHQDRARNEQLAFKSVT